MALVDLPHELIHCLQGAHFCAQEHASSWTAEHDASAAALNLLDAALRASAAAAAAEPALVRLPGLLETARLYHLREAAGQCLRAAAEAGAEAVAEAAQAEAEAGAARGDFAGFEARYRAWCAAGGFAALSEREAGDDIDLAKVRLALEAHPRALEPQLRALLHSRRGGSVEGFAAPREADVGRVGGSVLELARAPPEAGALSALLAALQGAGCE